VFTKDGESWILYHRHSIPFDPKFVGRQVCADRLDFRGDGTIGKVIPSNGGPSFVRGRDQGTLPVTVTASSQAGPSRGPERVTDDNYATRWAPAKGDTDPWIQLDLGSVRAITRQEIRLEYPWKPNRFLIESSLDGRAWSPVGTKMDPGSAAASPLVVETVNPALKARYLRLRFPEAGKGDAPSLWEWSVR
jgi:hypothetical protein